MAVSARGAFSPQSASYPGRGRRLAWPTGFHPASEGPCAESPGALGSSAVLTAFRSTPRSCRRPAVVRRLQHVLAARGVSLCIARHRSLCQLLCVTLQSLIFHVLCESGVQLRSDQNVCENQQAQRFGKTRSFAINRHMSPGKLAIAHFI